MMNPTVEEWQIKAKELRDEISDRNEAYQLNILTQALIDTFYMGANDGFDRALNVIKQKEE